MDVSLLIIAVEIPISTESNKVIMPNNCLMIFEFWLFKCKKNKKTMPIVKPKKTKLEYKVINRNKIIPRINPIVIFVKGNCKIFT